MPTFEISKKKLMKRLGKPLSGDMLADRIAMMGAVVEKAEGDSWTIEAFPNRPDLLSEEGLARALRGFLEIETGLPKYPVKHGSYRARVDDSVKGVREHVSAAVVTGLEIDGPGLISLMQMQEKLHSTHSRNRKLAAIGVHDLGAIEFPVEYTTVRGDYKFTPLGYGYEMAVSEILREHPKGREYAHLLEGTNLYPVWIDSKGDVLALPPIINGVKTAVTEKTRGVFIDVTGLNKRVVEQAMGIVLAQLSDMGGEIHSVDFGGFTTPNLEPRRMRLDPGYCNRLLGLSLGKAQIKRLLGMMRHGVDKKEGVLVASYRTDVLHPIDLVEDIAIAYGYENFEPVIPQMATIGGECKKAVWERRAAHLMAGFGFLECNSYHLTSADTPKKMGQRGQLVRTLNPVNANYNAIRNSLVPGLLQTLSENRHHDYPQRLFDIGTCVDGKLNETLFLSAVSCSAKSDFTEAKSYAESLLIAMGLEPEFKPVKNPSFLEGRAAAVFVNKKDVGVLGEVHPEALTSFQMGLPVACFEIALERLIS